MVLKLTVKVGANEFTVEGETTFAEILPTLKQWLDIQSIGNQAEVDAITARLKKQNDALAASVATHTP